MSTPTKPTSTNHTYFCRRGHQYISPIRATAVSCGECNHTHPKADNMMKERKR